ncbi:amidohydrolase family protein [Rapidithrix thailandica]|uniref:Amidohydrolase family protein n=1 Tax=Rapidithrix thailandica TaxID=413964 RepID=A0AAW9S9R0_9BACT
MKRLLYTFFACWLLLACQPEKKTSVDLLITGATIVDVKSGELIQERALVISADTIQAIINASEANTYQAKEVITAPGKFLIPGLWDMHVHFGDDTLIQENKNLLPLYVAHGITAVRDAAADISPSVLEWRKAINQGKLLGPKVFTAGPKIEGINSVWPGDLEVGTEEEMLQAMDSLEKIQVDFVKITDNTLSPELFVTAVKEARKRHLPVSGHIPFSVPLGELSDAGLSSVEHLSYLLKAGSKRDKEISDLYAAKKLSFWVAREEINESFDKEYALNVYRKLAENQTAVVPTINMTYTFANWDKHNPTQDDYLKYLGGGLIKTYAGRVKSLEGATREDFDKRREQYAKTSALLPLLQKAGVNIIAGTDAGFLNSYVYPGIGLHTEIELYVNAGLTPLQALQAATINGTRYFGNSDRYGSIEKGKSADILILNTNPLHDIKATRDIQTVIMRGTVFNREALDSLLEKVESLAVETKNQ